MAKECDTIVAGLYEYLAIYEPLFPKKTEFIPFPIVCDDDTPTIEQKDCFPARRRDMDNGCQWRKPQEAF